MFRKPMRLERWIAFDGVGLTDALTGNDESDSKSSEANDNEQHHAHVDGDSDAYQPDHADAVADLFGGFGMASFSAMASGTNTINLTFDSFPHLNGEIQLTFPIGLGLPEDFGGGTYLPFYHDGLASLHIGAAAADAIPVEHLFLSVTFPSHGSFTLFHSSLQSLNSFVNQHDLSPGDLVAFTPGGIPSTGIYTGTIHIGALVQYGANSYGLPGDKYVGVAYIKDNSVRFGFRPDATAEDVATILNSLVYVPNGQPRADDAFQVGLYYDTGNIYAVNKLIEGENCAIQDDNAAGVIKDASQACDEYGEVVGGGAEEKPAPTDPDPIPNPGSDPEPWTPPDDPGSTPDPEPIPENPEPVDPYVPPADETAGWDGQWDGTDSAGVGTDGDAAFAPDGDGSPILADGGDRDEWWTIITDTREEEYDDDGGEATPVLAELSVVEQAPDAPDDAFLQESLELFRDVEIALLGVREMTRTLEKAMDSLARQYMSRPPSSWSDPVRDSLRDMFAGAQNEKAELEAIARLLAGQTEAYASVAPERRDGMLTESIRELADNAARTAGEADALARALDKTAATLSGPEDGEAGDMLLGERFAADYGKFHGEWLERFALRDPMGKELEHHERFGAKLFSDADGPGEEVVPSG